VSFLLQRLGRACSSRRWLVLSVWLVVLVAVGGAAAAFGKPFTADVTIPGLESTRALTTVDERFGGAAGGGDDGATARVVVELPEGQTVTDPANAQRLGALAAELGQLPQVVAASNPLDQANPTVSPDLRAAYVDVTYAVPTGAITEDSREALTGAVEGAATDGWDVAVGGQAVTDPAALGGVGEVLGVVVAVVVLLVTYGTLVAAGLNLLTALVGVGVGALGIVAATALTDLQSTTTILAVMLGLAVGIDYGLFVLSRLRQELLLGRSVHEAVGLAVGTAGSAVVTAGLTVVIALAGLAVVGIPFLTQMGIAAAATVAVAVLVALTLLPALASLAGTRVLSRRQRRHLEQVQQTRRAAGHPEAELHPQHARATRRAGLLPAWARFVVRRRLVSVLSVVVLLGLVAVPVASLRTTLGDDSTAEEGSQQRRAYDLVAEHWGPGVSGPLLVLVDGGSDPAAQAAQLVGEVQGLGDIATDLPGGGVIGPVPSPDGTAALITVIPASGPSTDETTRLVSDIRALPATGDGEVSVTGSTAVSVDISAKLNGALPVYLAVVVGLALVLLLLVFRSVLVPVTAVLGFLLTVGAALGATVAIFEWGWLQQLVNTTTEAPIISFAPILVVGILFGLAMDYQIFIVSRIHEAHSRGVEPTAAVVTGFRAAAPVVLAAATIMLSVFGGFVPEGNATIKPIAFALAVGVLFDAVLVRMVLIPAVLALLGPAAWWLPRWLRWLPELDVEGRALEDAGPRPA